MSARETLTVSRELVMTLAMDLGYEPDAVARIDIDRGAVRVFHREDATLALSMDVLRVVS